MICKACEAKTDGWFRVKWKRNPEDEPTEEILCEPCVDKMLEEIDHLDDFMVTERWDDRNKKVDKCFESE